MPTLAAAAYLGPVRGHPLLSIALRAHALRLLIKDGRCVGVEFEQDGAVRRAHAEAEVVVTAGPTPDSISRRGDSIVPAGHLRALGIDVVADLPGVGENLHDHLLSPVIYSAERTIDPPAPGLWAAQSHLFWRSRPGLAVPDIQPIHFSTPLYEPWMEGPENGFTLLGGLIRPASRGRLRLTSADPRAEL